ncbi:ATP-binding protein [Leucobacter rhizosphaerae]|uniref:histidine kinase n=1 Tax=Leucobacter rhizosphaerae TaxID=2932245 RepID=A0ABY4FSA3_9MICO|nr:ATP-binding protein [Leucobacter rhizosphaerae]UOQ59122.1 ATP-binding protein [Leucobacter rhizosphaerae]
MGTWTPARGARIGLLFLPTLIVLVCVGVTCSIAVAVQERSIRAATADRVSDVARSLAQLEQVIAVLESDTTAGAGSLPTGSAALQPLATLIERAAGVDYVVIANEHGVRLTHPTPTKRGELVSTDHSEVLEGAPFLGTEAGTLGPTLRAKVPVIIGTDAEAAGADPVIGTVSVGILESRIAEDLNDALVDLLPWAGGALLVGAVASAFVSAAFARRLRRLDAMSGELDQQRRTAMALREQTHEFHTRMHVIHGLVSQGDTAEALTYIDGIAPLHSDREVTGVDAHPVLRAVVDALSAELRAAGAGLTVDVDVESEVGEEILLVIANLCRNAGESGASHVRLTLTETDGRIRGLVEDDGPGIPPQLGERIFSRGVTSKRDVTGTGRGVGLDLVRRALRSRNGTIEVGRSALGGASFLFECPVELSAEGRR